MAYNTFVQRRINQDLHAQFQHVNRDLFTNHNTQKHLVSHNGQGYFDDCSLPPRLQHGIGIPQNRCANFSNTQQTAAMSSQPQTLSQSEDFSALQRQMQPFFQSTPHNFNQNLHLRVPTSSCHPDTQEATTGGRQYTSVSNFKPPPPLHTNRHAVGPMHESYPQVFQVAQVCNQRISPLNNQQSVACFPTPSATPMHNIQFLDSVNISQQHMTAYNNNSNPDLIQSLQMNHPSFRNGQTTINNFGHTSQFLPANRRQEINLNRTSSTKNQSSTNTCPTQRPQPVSLESSNLQQSNQRQSNNIPVDPQRQRNTAASVAPNQLHSMHGLNNHMSSFGRNPLAEYREMALPHQHCMANLDMTTSKSSPLFSYGGIPLLSIVHSRSMSPYSGPVQNNGGENANYPGSQHFTNMQPRNMNPTDVEKFINQHPTDGHISARSKLIDETTRQVNNHSIDPISLPNEPSITSNETSSHWYKYPEEASNSPHTSDVQAIRADPTDYNSTPDPGTCYEGQIDEEAAHLEQVAQALTDLHRRVNMMPENDFQVSSNSSIEEMADRTGFCISDQSISPTCRTETTKSAQIINQELVDVLNALVTKSKPNDVTSNSNLFSDREFSDFRKQFFQKIESCGVLQMDKLATLQLTKILAETFIEKAQTYNNQSAKSATTIITSKNKEDTTPQSVTKATSIQNGKDCTNSDNITDITNSNILKPVTPLQKVTLQMNTTDIQTTSIQQSGSSLAHQNISARTSSPDSGQASANIQSCVTATVDSVSNPLIHRWQQHSASAVNTTLERKTGSSAPLKRKRDSNAVNAPLERKTDNSVVYASLERKTDSGLTNTTLERKTSSISAETKTTQEKGCTLLKKSLQKDSKLKVGNSTTGLAASVKSRRDTSPCSSERKLLDSEQKLAPRLSLDSQTIQQAKNTACSMDEGLSNKQKPSYASRSDLTPKATKKLSGSREKNSMTAKEKVFNLWKSGQVCKTACKQIGDKAILRATKPKFECINRKPTKSCSKQESKKICTSSEVSNSAALKKTSTEEVLVESSPAISNSTARLEDVHSKSHLRTVAQSNTTHTMIYIMFHGHKLICLKSDTGSQILLCQFLYDCFPDTDLGLVNNCINKTLQINTIPLVHPEKEKITMFLKRNYYQLGEMLQAILVTDAQKIYHHMFEITNCTNITCVIELPSSTVDLDGSDFICSRRTLTREIMSRKTTIEQSEEQDTDPEESFNASTDVENRENEGGDDADTNLQDEPLWLQPPARLPPPPSILHPGSPGSDLTVAYGKGEQDDLDDVAVVVVVDDPHLISWSPGTEKDGGLSDTWLGKIRSYRHNDETFLAVDDMCKVLGDHKFFHGVMEGSIILYSCCQEIADFLNSLSKQFPPLKSLKQSLVKSSDIGINETVATQHMSQHDDISYLQITCKEECLSDDCTPSKQARLDDNTAVLPELYNGDAIKKELSATNNKPGISVLQQDTDSSDMVVIVFQDKSASSPDRGLAEVEMTEIMMKDVQNEASAGKGRLPSSMPTQCEATDRNLGRIDSNPLEEPSLYFTEPGLCMNNVIMVFSNDDVVSVRSDACSSPCSLKSPAPVEETRTPILSDQNNPTATPTISCNGNPDQNRCKNLVQQTPATFNNLEIVGMRIGNNFAEIDSHHASTRQPIKNTDQTNKSVQDGASKHVEIPSNHREGSFSPSSSIGPVTERCLKSVPKSNSLTEMAKCSLGTSSLANRESTGDETPLASTTRAAVQNCENEFPPKQGEMPVSVKDITTVEPAHSVFRNSSELVMCDRLNAKIVPVSLEEKVIANDSELVVKSALEYEQTQERTRTQLSLLMLALSSDIDTATSLTSTVRVIGNRRAIDDIDIMNTSAPGTLFPPRSRKVFTKLWQQQRALTNLVDMLRKRLEISEAAREKSEKRLELSEAAREKSDKYYEGVIHDITSTFKNGDLESIDC